MGSRLCLRKLRVADQAASGGRCPFPGDPRAGGGPGFVSIFKKPARAAGLNSEEGEVLGAGPLGVLFRIPSLWSPLPASGDPPVTLYPASFSSFFPTSGIEARGSGGQRGLCD